MKLILEFLAVITLYYGNRAAAEVNPLASTFVTAKGNMREIEDRPDTDIESRILGGRPANWGQFPWQAALQMENQCFLANDTHLNSPLPTCCGSICGATLISTRHLITAAHCLKTNSGNIVSKAAKVFVKLGSVNNLQFGNDYIASGYDLHPDWDMYNVKNDIGIVYLSGHFYNGRIDTRYIISPIALPRSNEDFVEYVATASGYGISDDVPTFWGKFNGNNNVQLNYVQLKVLSNKECNSIISSMTKLASVDESQICTSNLDRQRRPVLATCNGDSGGPLTVRKRVIEDNKIVAKDVLIGVTSYGIGRDCTASPSVYTRITHFKDFILSHAPVQELQFI